MLQKGTGNSMELHMSAHLGHVFLFTIYLVCWKIKIQGTGEVFNSQKVLPDFAEDQSLVPRPKPYLKL